jgi:HK97 family phage major capsid protein
MEQKIVELHELIKQLRDKWEEHQKGLYTKAEFAEFEKKINERIDRIETALNRPPVARAEEEPQDQAALQKKQAFLAWFRKGRAALAPEQVKALVEDATGEILVPEQLEAEIYRELPKITVVRGLATVRQITIGNRVRRRSLTEVTVGWGKLETGTTIAESTLVPGEEWLYVEDLYGLTKVGEDELADTDVALESIITDSFARAFAEAEDAAFIKGRGHQYQEPEGILNGTVVQRVNAGQAGGITLDDLIKLEYEVPEQYARNGAYLVHSSTVQQMRLMKDQNGQYLWQPQVAAGQPPTFNGYPVYRQNDIPEIPAPGTAADVAIFGDVRLAYRIVDRMGMTMQRLTELYAEQGLVGFKAHRRVGGGVVRANALRILRVPAA